MNKAQSLLVLLERRIKPMKWQEYAQHLSSIIDKELSRYMLYSKTANYYEILYNSSLGKITIKYPEVQDDTARRLFIKINSFSHDVGWWHIEPINKPIPKENERFLSPEKIIVFAPNPHPDSDKRITEIPKILYHSTVVSSLMNIFKKGLLPKPAKYKTEYEYFGHPWIVYVAKSPDISHAVLLQKGYEAGEVVTLEIHTD